MYFCSALYVGSIHNLCINHQAKRVSEAIAEHVIAMYRKPCSILCCSVCLPLRTGVGLQASKVGSMEMLEDTLRVYLGHSRDVPPTMLHANTS
jgi:hypothetical protein